MFLVTELGAGGIRLDSFRLRKLLDPRTDSLLRPRPKVTAPAMTMPG